MKKRSVVTGGAGFIGANLVHRLVSEGQDVHVITRLGGSLWRIDDILKKVTIHNIGFDDQNKLQKLCLKLQPQSVYHLAAYGSYPTQQDVRQMVVTNIVGTMNLLESLVPVPYENLIIIGSSSEYGKKRFRMKETDALDPNNYYAVTKAAQAHLASVWAAMHDKPVTILRLFNVYGYYEEKGRLVRSVIESPLKGEPIKLATGNEARDFIFIDDVVDACCHAARRKIFRGEVFNVGTGVQTTIYELAKLVVTIAGIKVPIQRNAYAGRSWDTRHWCADMEKTKRTLRWKPCNTLSSGLKKTIAWYRIHQ